MFLCRLCALLGGDDVDLKISVQSQSTFSDDGTRSVPNKSRAPRQTGPLNRIDALVQQSAKTVQHTKVLNQLARSVRKINEELTGAELDDYKRYV
ncbi:unnamed protein product [Echinostoma caproni]|uniref:Uncharacterized protein n=1 Tax=Echinostoma caproni TaxID=27848 RepID=A0A183ALK0_9TREM|nr:unnamed protein product [Echinostoma caproni]